MTKLDKIEKDAESLTPEELAAFRKWSHAYDADRWDRQFEADVSSGKLERLRQEARAEYQGAKSG